MVITQVLIPGDPDFPSIMVHRFRGLAYVQKLGLKLRISITVTQVDFLLTRPRVLFCLVFDHIRQDILYVFFKYFILRGTVINQPQLQILPDQKLCFFCLL